MQQLRQRIDQPELTPSARVIEAIREHGSYFDFAFEMSQAHTQTLQSQPLDDDAGTLCQQCAELAATAGSR